MKGSSAPCDDGKACTTDSCDKLGGCKNVAQTGQACDDGNACTVGDLCLASGTCASGKAKVCQDNLACTADSCDIQTGCVNAVQDKAACDAGACKGTVSGCDDAEACTQDTCDKVKGCLFNSLDGKGCDDGDACTKPDACASGLCKGGAAVNCDDSNVCTLDLCAPQTGCVTTKLQGAACDDGKVCTTADACSNGVCAGLTKTCDDSNPCTQDNCDPKQGCINQAASLPCNDGDECTAGDACANGKCAGTSVDCDDANACTVDSCNKVVGCLVKNAASGAACEDGNGCTTDTCNGVGVCLSAPALWSREIGTGLYPLDIALDGNGDAIVVGQIGTTFFNSGSGKSFFLRLPLVLPKGEAVVFDSRVALRAIRRRQDGVAGFVGIDGAFGDSPGFVGGDPAAKLVLLDGQGKLLQVMTTKGYKSGQAHRWQSLDVNKTHAVVAGTRVYQDKAEDNGVFVGHVHLASKVATWHPLWHVPGATKHGALEVLGGQALANDDAVTVVRVLRAGDVWTTWMLRTAPNGVQTPTKLFEAHATSSSLLVKFVPADDGGFDIHRPTTSLRFNQLGAQVGVPFKAFLPNLSPLLPALRRGTQTVAFQPAGNGVDTTLSLYHRGGLVEHSATLVGPPVTIARPGALRELLLLSKPADHLTSNNASWVVSRRNPWGSLDCDACYTQHAAGCGPSGGCAGDSCVAGVCSSATPHEKCSDPTNPCNLQKCNSAGKKDCQVLAPAADGSDCGPAGAKCTTDPAQGKCSKGVCAGTPATPPVCDDSNACTIDFCESAQGCQSRSMPVGTLCGSGTTCGQLTQTQCLADSSVCIKEYVGGATTLTQAEVSLDLPSPGAGAVRWAQVQVTVPADGQLQRLNVHLRYNGQMLHSMRDATAACQALFGFCDSAVDSNGAITLDWPSVTQPIQWPFKVGSVPAPLGAGQLNTLELRLSRNGSAFPLVKVSSWKVRWATACN